MCDKDAKGTIRHWNHWMYSSCFQWKEIYLKASWEKNFKLEAFLVISKFCFIVKSK